MLKKLQIGEFKIDVSVTIFSQIPCYLRAIFLHNI